MAQFNQDAWQRWSEWATSDNADEVGEAFAMVRSMVTSCLEHHAGRNLPEKMQGLAARYEYLAANHIHVLRAQGVMNTVTGRRKDQTSTTQDRLNAIGAFRWLCETSWHGKEGAKFETERVSLLATATQDEEWQLLLGKCTLYPADTIDKARERVKSLFAQAGYTLQDGKTKAPLEDFAVRTGMSAAEFVFHQEAMWKRGDVKGGRLNPDADTARRLVEAYALLCMRLKVIGSRAGAPQRPARLLPTGVYPDLSAEAQAAEAPFKAACPWCARTEVDALSEKLRKKDNLLATCYSCFGTYAVSRTRDWELRIRRIDPPPPPLPEPPPPLPVSCEESRRIGDLTRERLKRAPEPAWKLPAEAPPSPPVYQIAISPLETFFASLDDTAARVPGRCGDATCATAGEAIAAVGLTYPRGLVDSLLLVSLEKEAATWTSGRERQSFEPWAPLVPIAARRSLPAGRVVHPCPWCGCNLLMPEAPTLTQFAAQCPGCSEYLFVDAKQRSPSAPLSKVVGKGAGDRISIMALAKEDDFRRSRSFLIGEAPLCSGCAAELPGSGQLVSFPVRDQCCGTCGKACRMKRCSMTHGCVVDLVLGGQAPRASPVSGARRRAGESMRWRSSSLRRSVDKACRRSLLLWALGAIWSLLFCRSRDAAVMLALLLLGLPWLWQAILCRLTGASPAAAFCDAVFPIWVAGSLIVVSFCSPLRDSLYSTRSLCDVFWPSFMPLTATGAFLLGMSTACALLVASKSLPAGRAAGYRATAAAFALVGTSLTGLQCSLWPDGRQPQRRYHPGPAPQAGSEIDVTPDARVRESAPRAPSHKVMPESR